MMPASLDKLGEVRQAGLNRIRLASEHGVDVAYGGDMRDSQSAEFEIRAQVQEPFDLIQSATDNAFRFLRADGDFGERKPGALTGLLVTTGDPLQDVAALSDPERCIRHVASQGRLVSQDAPSDD